MGVLPRFAWAMFAVPAAVLLAALLAQTAGASTQVTQAKWSSSAPDSSSKSVHLLTDIGQIKQYWGHVKPHNDTPASYFGVPNVGLPYGCGYEQVSVFHRHGARYTTGADEDQGNNKAFAKKVDDIRASYGKFSGPISFLNSWKYYLSTETLLPAGAAQEYTSGAHFWADRGRLLYNATYGQAYYDLRFANGSERPKPVLRTTGEARIHESALAWTAGFFGPFNTTDKYDLVVIPEGGTENNTLASYDSCPNAGLPEIGSTGDAAVFGYIADGFLDAATNRLNGYLTDGGLSLTANDTYAMMEICSYEYAAFGSSDFCGLFTRDEWEGFEYTLDLEYYYNYSFGNAVGRAQGLGSLQETLARLKNQYITSSNSSVNATLNNNPSTFPLGQKFYMDMSHDDILISLVTAESIEYFNTDMPLTGPPPADRTFRLSSLTPFATRFYTELIGCSAPNPAEVQTPYTMVYPEQNGYDPANAPYKFVRQVWNGAIVPLATISGGYCAGRTDGMCELDKFLESQEGAEEKANYQFGCFGNYTNTGGNGDGSVF